MSTVVEQGNTFIVVSRLSDCQFLRLKRKVVARHVVDTWGRSALLRRSETCRHIVIRLLVTAALRSETVTLWITSRNLSALRSKSSRLLAAETALCAITWLLGTGC